MKKFFFIISLLISICSFSQTDEYYRTVDWKFYPDSIVQLTDSTYQLVAIPFDYNDPGSINRIVGNYVVDFVGHRFSVIDSTSTKITVLDVYHTGQAPQTGQIARCYLSVGNGEAEFIGSVDYSPLDESAKWKLNGADNELIWRSFIRYSYVGVVNEPTITKNPDGTVTIASNGDYIFNEQADGKGRNIKIENVTGTTLNITDNAVSYIYVDYNNGTPFYAFASENAIFFWDFTKLPVIRVTRLGTQTHFEEPGEFAVQLANKLMYKDVAVNTFQRQSGLTLSTAATRISTISSGVAWFAIKYYNLTANTAGSAGVLYQYYLSGGNWLKSLVTSYDADYYSDGTNRQTLGNNKWVAKYFYRDVGDDNEAYYIHGNQYNTSAEALAETLPFAPNIITAHSIYVGKIVIQKGSTNGTAYPRQWEGAIQSATSSNHADLTNLGWTVSNHTDGANKIAAFDATGAATTLDTITNLASQHDLTFKVTRPASSTDNAIARFDGTTGKLIQNSNVTISDVGAIVTPSTIQATTGLFTDLTNNTVPYKSAIGLANSIIRQTSVAIMTLNGTATGGWYINGGNATGTGGGYTLYQTDATNKFLVGTETAALGGTSGGGIAYVYGDFPFKVHTNGVNRLSINATGGTFTGYVQATTAKLTNLTDGYLPYHVSDASGLANSPFYTNGTSIGFGTTSPQQLLGVTLAGTPFHISSSTTAGRLLISGTPRAQIFMTDLSSALNKKVWLLSSFNGDFIFNRVSDAITTISTPLTITSTDNTLFGTTTDSGDRINVNGTIKATTAKLTNLTDNYIPKHTSDATGLQNSNIFFSGNIARYETANTFSNDRDIVDKAYVDAIAAGNMPKLPVDAATTGNITLSGTQTIDGYVVSVGQRVLVWKQTTTSQNGVYIVASGAWTRAADLDTWTELYKAYVTVLNGAQSGSSFVCTVPSTGTLGTDPVTWILYNAPTNITVSSPLAKSGNNISLGYDTNTLDVASNLLKVKDNVFQPLSSILTNTTASFTTTLETKLNGIADGAEVNVNADWSASSGDAQILNKPTALSQFTNDLGNYGGFLTAETDPIFSADSSKLLHWSDTLNLTKGIASQYDLTTGLATKQNTLTTGNLTENITGLQFDNTRQVIGGASQLSLTSGYFIPTTTEQTNWNAAYTNRITSLTTTGSSGVATLISNVLNIPNYTLSGMGGVPTTRTLTINGTTQDLSANRTWNVGTVTSVGLSVPTGLTVSGSPITSSGTLAISLASGYSIPTTANQTNWTTGYNDKINSLAFTGTNTKTLTLTQQDGGTVSNTFTDLDVQTLSADSTTTTIGITASGSNSRIHFNVDKSATNELQNLSLGTVTTTTQPLNISNGSGVTLPAATTSTAGLLTSADKTKLDGIATGANNYVLPLAANGTRGGVQIGYTATGANLPLQLSSEKGYVGLTNSAIVAGLGYTPYNATNPAGYTTNTGTVTSVGSGLGLTGGSITTSGTLSVDTASAVILSRQRAANTYQPKGTYQTGTESYISNLSLSGNTLTSTGVGSAFNSTVGNIANIEASNFYTNINTFSVDTRFFNSTANDYGYISTNTSGLMSVIGTDLSNGGLTLRSGITSNKTIRLDNNGIFIPTLPAKSSETEVVYINSSTGLLSKGTVSGGTTNHAALSNLSFATAGHTDFVSTNTNQTISGIKTFSANPEITGTNPQLTLDGTNSSILRFELNNIFNGGLFAQNSGKVDFYAGGTSYVDMFSDFKLESKSAGENAIAGMLYYDSDDNTFRGYNGSSWIDLGASGGGTTTNALTMNNSGSGAASGSTFDGSVARTISYNTIGAAGLAASNTFTGVTQTIQAAAATLKINASTGTPGLRFENNGTFTGGFYPQSSGKFDVYSGASSYIEFMSPHKMYANSTSTPSAVAGGFYYDTDVNKPYYYNGSTWVDWSGSSQWTNDANGITYAGKIGVNTASNASYDIITGTNGIRSTGAISAAGNVTGANLAGGNIIATLRVGTPRVDIESESASYSQSLTAGGSIWVKSDNRAIFTTDTGDSSTEYDLTGMTTKGAVSSSEPTTLTNKNYTIILNTGVSNLRFPTTQLEGKIFIIVNRTTSNINLRSNDGSTSVGYTQINSATTLTYAPAQTSITLQYISGGWYRIQ